MNKKFELPRDFVDRLEFAALDDEEKQRILDKARAHVAEERKSKAEEAFLEEALTHERRRHRPAEQFEDVLIDLPGHAVRLLFDGVEYIHAFTYRVTALQAASMREQMRRCWEHEDEIGGANRNFYRKPRELRIGPNQINVASKTLLGV